MDYTAPLITAFASLVGAAIAASVALLVSILAKETKTSELRQQWIDAVRGDLAEFMAVVSKVEAMVRETDVNFKTKAGRTTFYETHGEAIAVATMLEGRLKLRLNPNEHKVLIDLLELRSAFPRRLGNPLTSEYDDKIVAEGQRVLKQEWQRVKKGEPAFYWTKRLALAIVAGAISAIVTTAIRAS